MKNPQDITIRNLQDLQEAIDLYAAVGPFNATQYATHTGKSRQLAYATLRNLAYAGALNFERGWPSKYWPSFQGDGIDYVRKVLCNAEKKDKKSY